MDTSRAIRFAAVAGMSVVFAACGEAKEQDANGLPVHKIRKNDGGTIHLESADPNMSEYECRTLINFYKKKAEWQVSVYKPSPNMGVAPWCVINLKDPANKEVVFNNILFAK